MWSCPKCNRSFKSANQYHSCAVIDIESHFKNKPQVIRDIFDKLTAVVKTIGETDINVVKSAIFLKKRTTFIEIKPKKEYVLIAFYLENEVTEFPVVRSLQTSKNRIAHVVHLQHPDEINTQLITWLKQSYKLISEN
jgi:hypothetical protein